MKRILNSCWSWCAGGIAGPILARSAFSTRPYRDEAYVDEEDTEDERDETMRYFKEALTRSQEESALKEGNYDDETNALTKIDESDGGEDNSGLILQNSIESSEAGSSKNDGRPSIVISNCSEQDVEHPDGSETPFSINSSPVRSLNFLGKLMISAQYSPPTGKLQIGIKEAFDLAIPEDSSAEYCHSQVRVCLLPEKKQKFKTQIVPGVSPKYSELHTFTNIHQDKLSKCELRFRIYRPMGLRKRNQLIGESLLQLCLIDARAGTLTYHMLDLSLKCQNEKFDFQMISPSNSDFSVNSRRESMLDDRTGAFCTQPSGKFPELLVSLCFNDNTGKLVVVIEKGSCLGVHSKAPDTMVKVTVLSPYGEEIGKSKTGIRKDNSNPVYSETFIFQVPTSELKFASVLVQVYCFLGVWRRKMLLGWLTMGQNSSSPMQEQHWAEMMGGFGITTSKWHVLSQP